MAKLLAIALITAIFLGCSPIKENSTHPKLEEYKSKIEKYMNEAGRNLEKERKEIEKCLHIPKSNLLPKVKNELVKRFEYSDAGLFRYGPEKPNIHNPLSFNELLVVDTDGNMYFSRAGYVDDNERDVLSPPKKYIMRKDEVIDLYNRDLQSITSSDENAPYPPTVFSLATSILHGGVNEYYYFRLVDFRYMGDYLRDVLLVKRNKKVDVKILPYTNFFRSFDAYSYKRKTIDNSKRIYMGLWSWDKEDYRKINNFQVLAYDFEKDTMYFIEWPKLTPKEETIIQVSYVIGDDDAIYFQVVTDAACSIYRITPLWDEPMESVEYMPMFYEFYPDLKEKEAQAVLSN